MEYEKQKASTALAEIKSITSDQTLEETEVHFEIEQDSQTGKSVISSNTNNTDSLKPISGILRSNRTTHLAFYSNHLKGDLLSAILEERIYPIMTHAKRLLTAAFKIIANSPDYIHKALVLTLRLQSVYKENIAKINSNLMLTSDLIRSEISSIGRNFEDLTYELGKLWFEMFLMSNHVDEKHVTLDTHRHGLTDTCLNTLKGCARYSNICGILLDDEMIIKNFSNQQKFSEFCKRGIGALKLCLEQKALIKFKEDTVAKHVFLLNNYSYMLKYLNSHSELTEIIQLRFPDILEIIGEGFEP